MAPRKRKAEEGGEEAGKPAEMASGRMTRSATRRASSNSAVSADELAKAQFPKKNKKEKVTGRRKKKKKKQEEVKSEEENELEKEEAEEEEKVKEVILTEKGKPEEDADGDESKEKTVVIEHCKQCNSFKTRANQVKEGLEKGVPGIRVLLNPEKPRRGCFEIRKEGGEKFISLLDMKRPFNPMKNLVMDEVISDIIAKLK